LRFFTASRAHHAEIGGLRPGSAFQFARNLAEEGVVMRHQLLARDGRFLENELKTALTVAPYPSRTPKENIADIRAAIAANQLGVRELQRMIDAQSWPVVKSYMTHIRDSASAKTRDTIDRLHDGEFTFTDPLDDGAPLRIRVTVNGRNMCVDFTGTGAVNNNSLNANPAIVDAAILYCLRCLIDEDIPLNSGVLEPVTITVPPNTMLNPPHHADPTRHAPVVGGNVEISQRIVDVFFGALGIVAASQGTMNNLVFGNERFGYYETICGGAGAGADFHGASAVHTHMTNTRLTDPEVMEQQVPVRVRRFAIRRGSGGIGRHHGGDGVTREIEFLEPVEVSLLTQRRRHAPFGMNGGQDGRPGENTIHRAHADSPETLDGLAQLDANPGDCLIIETPGGGGYGSTCSGPG
ncbi:MAG: hydantoinase B/oxoprolinase family protein, partial [Planctomycetota bacterium]